MPIVCPVFYASRWDADRVMNDLLGNHIELRHRIPRPVVGQWIRSVFVGTRGIMWPAVASRS